MKNILFLTSSFPYSDGEQFIESEILYWSKELGPDQRLVLSPFSTNGSKKPIPNNIDFEPYFAKHYHSKALKILYFFFTLFSPVFFYECKFLFQSNLLTLARAFKALRECAQVNLATRILRTICITHSIDTIYTYWNSTQFYSAAILKREHVVDTVFTRVHRFDLYENLSQYSYMPLKRQLSNHADCIFAISNESKKYYEKQFKTKNVLVSRLGVECSGFQSKPSKLGYLNIISISNCSEVKRIDKIINSIAIFANNHCHIKIQWTHIGDGILRSYLEKLASEKLCINNVQYKFSGVLTNNEVKSYLKKNDVDVLINSSESEGVPVSIMEAMSYGIPVIAPDVGGVSELVNSDFGVLTSKECTIKELSEALYVAHNSFKDPFIRDSCISKIKSDYEMSKNYVAFIQELNNISKGKDIECNIDNKSYL